MTEVVTFDRHPATVVSPDSAPLQLTDLEQKLELLASCSVDRTVVIRFDEARAAEPAEDFVTEVLVGALGARLVVVGSDFHFGHDRHGNVELLEKMGEKLGFEVIGVSLEGDPSGVPVSSTRIRGLIAAGGCRRRLRLSAVTTSFGARSCHGDARGGSELGFPTANVDVPAGMALPRSGIYACWYLSDDGTRHRAAVSLGHRPTFHPEGSPPVLEAYLLDFEGDLYGEPARVRFVERLRDELKFDSIDDLIAQMERDVEADQGGPRERWALGADQGPACYYCRSSRGTFPTGPGRERLACSPDPNPPASSLEPFHAYARQASDNRRTPTTRD